jgi:hypothetical protein
VSFLKGWKIRTKSLNLEPEDVEFNAASRETVAPPAPEPEAYNPDAAGDDSAEVKRGFFSRIFSKEKPEAKFQIQPQWARGCVKVPFWALAKYSHPSWAVNDEEAERVRPEMQIFLQQIFDKYVPSLLNSWAAKHSEFTNLALAMVALGYVKYTVVRDAVEAETAARKIVEFDSAHEPIPSGGPEEPLPRPSLCGSCKHEFPNANAYKAHLPCFGAA